MIQKDLIVSFEMDFIIPFKRDVILLLLKLAITIYDIFKKGIINIKISGRLLSTGLAALALGFFFRLTCWLIEYNCSIFISRKIM